MALSLAEKLAKGNHGVKDDRQAKLYDSGIDTLPSLLLLLQQLGS